MVSALIGQSSVSVLLPAALQLLALLGGTVEFSKDNVLLTICTEKF